MIEALISALFIVSGTMKLVDLAGFAAAVRRYELLRDGAVELAARAIAVVEVGTGILLTTRWDQVIWLCLGVVLTACATVVTLVKLIQGHRIPCGCFGGSDETLVGWWGVVRNLVIVALGVGAFVARIGGTYDQLVMSDWIMLVAASGALWIGTAQAAIALRVFQHDTDT